MSRLPTAPIVNLNTASLIENLIGAYDETTQALIHKIAKNQPSLMAGCNTLADYEKNMKAFIIMEKVF